MSNQSFPQFVVTPGRSKTKAAKSLKRMRANCLAEANLLELQGDVSGSMRAELTAYALDKALRQVEAQRHA